MRYALGWRGVVVCLLLTMAASPLRAAGLQTLKGHIPKEAAKATPIGRLPPGQQMNLAIGLPLRDSAGLDAFLEQVYDPAHPNFRHYLTPEQFGTQFGPSAQDYQAVVAFAKANGLKVTGTYPNRLMVSVNGSVADIEKTLHVNLRTYQHPNENRTFFAPDVEPSLDLATPVLQISGLDNFRLPKPKHKVMDKSASAPTPKTNGSGPLGNFLGGDFRKAYVPGTALTGAGQSVGMFEFDGYYASDITAYTTLSGYSAVPVQNILVDGVSGTPGYSHISGAVLEVSLDIEMAIAMAPGISSVVVYEGNLANSILNAMATNASVLQLSTSWSWGSTTNVTTDLIFKEFAAQGQSFFNASGDSDAYPVGTATGEPNDNPYITIVGGTSLTTSAGAWFSETVWNRGSGVGGSGGISTFYSIPTWQQGISMTANQGSTTMRNLPDVALTAESIWVTYNNGSTTGVGGTSCAAPLWAGFMALVNQQAAQNGHAPAGFINPTIYAIGKSNASYSTTYFHDITSGNNTNNSSAGKFLATSGYDLCTGWGTPRVGLISALAIPDSLGVLPRADFFALGPSHGPFSATTTTYALTNSGNSSFSWSLINTASWLTVSASSGPLIVGGSTNITVSLNNTASNLAMGVYSATLVFSNQTSHATQTRSCTLSMNGSFETGNFSGWTLLADPTYTTVTNGTSWAKSGTYGAQLGEASDTGILTLNLSTTPGQAYYLSLWMDSPDGKKPNQFTVSWNNSMLFTNYNMTAFGWTNIQYIVTATDTTTTLQLGFRDDPTYLGLDNVIVMPIDTPALLVTNAVSSPFQFTWNANTGLVYQVQYKTNLMQANWVNLGSATTAVSTNMSYTDTPGTDSPRFYRVLTLP